MAPANGNRCVLIVDDDGESRDVLREIVLELGFRAVVASDGAEGLKRLREEGPNTLVLLDLEMPVMDGWQFCQAKERDAVLRDVPVVVISASGPFQRRPEKIERFMAKPIDFTEFAEVLERYAVPQRLSA